MEFFVLQVFCGIWTAFIISKFFEKSQKKLLPLPILRIFQKRPPTDPLSKSRLLELWKTIAFHLENRYTKLNTFKHVLERENHGKRVLELRDKSWKLHGFFKDTALSEMKHGNQFRLEGAVPDHVVQWLKKCERIKAPVGLSKEIVELTEESNAKRIDGLSEEIVGSVEKRPPTEPLTTTSSVPVSDERDDVDDLAGDPDRLFSERQKCKTSVSEILEGQLFISGMDFTKEMLKKINISSVLNLYGHGCNIQHDEIFYKKVFLANSLGVDIFEILYDLILYIDDEIREKHRKVLVHCQAGTSRSVTIVCAYLMYRRGETAQKTLNILRGKRPIVDPNACFIDSLVKFEKRLKNEIDENFIEIFHLRTFDPKDPFLVVSSVGCADWIVKEGERMCFDSRMIFVLVKRNLIQLVKGPKAKARLLESENLISEHFRKRNLVEGKEGEVLLTTEEKLVKAEFCELECFDDLAAAMEDKAMDGGVEN